MPGFCFRFALMTFVMGALVLQGCAEQKAPDQKDPDHVPAVISYVEHIKPIFDAKCVACHSCFDAPAQLNLTNAEAVLRGAIKGDPYAFTLEAKPYHRMEKPEKSIDDLRKAGWFSVLDGGQDSILGKMVTLGHANPWKPNERIPDHINISWLGRAVFAQYAR